MDIIYDRFIAPFKNKKIGNIGVELEYPLINLDKKTVDEKFAIGYLKQLADEGFTVEDYDTFGNPAFVVNKDGDVISFDNSYNNIEFSMNYCGNLLTIKERFIKLYRNAAEYFKKQNYIIAGVGYNPYKQYIKQAHVSYPVYNMVDKFLHDNCEGTHNIPDFPAYLSSVQTHLDADMESMPILADLFSQIDFAVAYIFSNSPCGDYICYRDYLWENSAFGKLNDNTGSYEKPFNDIDGVIDSFKNRSVFNRIRNGRYEIFTPVTVKEYFNESNAEDIKQFLSFKNIEITARGTIEVRSTCTQPLTDAFAPSGFYLGLAHNLKKAREAAYSIELRDSLPQLRHKAIKGDIPHYISKESLSEYLLKLIDVAKEGLVKRGFGEEKLILPLYERAKKLICPAIVLKKRLENGEKTDTVLKEFSEI